MASYISGLILLGVPFCQTWGGFTLPPHALHWLKVFNTPANLIVDESGYVSKAIKSETPEIQKFPIQCVSNRYYIPIDSKFEGLTSSQNSHCST